jgi:uncharacterized protein YaiI (UPF0178 family)
MTDLKVIIDADACPKSCLLIAQKLAPVYSYEVITIASFNHQIENPHHITVGNEPQATDIAVINRCRPGDIVITQDWGLAAMVLAKKASAISPHGKIFKPEQMELLLEERNLLARFRKGGGRTKGPAKRTKDEDEMFERNFIKLLKE